jgi:MFS family permease
MSGQVGHAGIEIDVRRPDRPHQQPLIAVLLTFAIGFLMRPVGSLVLSPMADRYGRRRVLALTIILMGIGSLIIAIGSTIALAVTAGKPLD